MTFCSILTPAFSVNSYEYSTFVKQCCENFGVKTDDFELYALVPLKDVKNPIEAVVKLKKNNFSLSKIEDLLAQKDQLLSQLQRSRDALSSYSEKLQDRKTASFDEKTNRKIIKLEEDNKKLRSLLK